MYERLEDMTELVLGNARTRILHANDAPRSVSQCATRRSSSHRRSDDVDAAAWWREAHGIAQEVDEHLAHAVDVTAIHDVLSRLGETHGDLTHASLGRDERRRLAITCRAAPS